MCDILPLQHLVAHWTFNLKLYLIPVSEQYYVGVHMIILHTCMFCWCISGV